MTNVLLAEDDTAIAEPLARALTREGYNVVVQGTGQGAIDSAEAADVVVLDLGLPDMDGLDVARAIRGAGLTTPILVLTARADEVDLVVGLDAGADDYVTKPFSVEALVARIRAVLRRTTVPAAAERAHGPILRVADLELDEARWEVRRGGVTVDLSPTEFRLLAFLMANAGLVLTKRRLLEEVWGYGGSSQVLETYISYLRRKLDPLGPPLIHTQRGIGYALRPPQDS